MLPKKGWNNKVGVHLVPWSDGIKVRIVNQSTELTYRIV